MKTLTFLISAMLVCCQMRLMSQGCLPEGIIFNTQANIDNYPVNYPGCQHIEGNVLIYGGDISNLDGLSGVTTIDGNLDIGSLEYGGNPLLTNLEGLGNLLYVGGHLGIKYNESLAGLEGLEGLYALGGSLSIARNAVTSLDGLQGLTTIGGDCEIRDNCLLTSLAGLDNITFIGGYLCIQNNVDLKDLGALHNLASIQKDLLVGYNPLLTNLAGLDNLAFLGNDMNIYFNSGLTSLAGLEGLTSVNSVIVQGNEALTGLTGLENMTTIKGSLCIGGINQLSGNPALSDLDALAGVTSIGINLGIKYNDALTSLEGLTNVASIGSMLVIHSNDGLASLEGLDHIDAATIRSLEITGNGSLSDCDAESVCAYLARPDGIVEISGNDGGCSSRQEVEEVCSPGGVGAVTCADNFSVFPNPVGNYATVEYQLKESAFVSLVIYDHLGQAIDVLAGQQQAPGTYRYQWNPGPLPSGIYFCVLNTDDALLTIKLIRQ